MEKPMKLGIEENDIKLAEKYAYAIKKVGEKFTHITGVNITGKLSEKSLDFLKVFDSKLDQILTKSGAIKFKLVTNPRDVLFLDEFAGKLGAISLDKDVSSSLDSYIDKLTKIHAETSKIRNIHKDIQESVARTRITEKLHSFSGPADLGSKTKPRTKADKAKLEPTFLKEIEKRVEELYEKAKEIDINIVTNPTDLMFLESLTKKVQNIGLDANAINEIDEYIKKLDIISKKTPKQYKKESEDVETKKQITKKLYSIDIEGDTSSIVLSTIEKKVDEVQKLAGNIQVNMVKDPSDVVFLDNLKKRLRNLTLDDNAISQLDEYIKKLKELDNKTIPSYKKLVNMSLFNLQNLLKASTALKAIKILAQGIKEVFVTMFPIAILMSIASFVRGMIDADKQTKTLMRSMMGLAAQSKDIDNFGGGGEGFKKTMHTMRTSIMDFAKRWGITFDEAQQRLESTAGSGVFLSELLGRQAERTNGKISKFISGNKAFEGKALDDIQTMATYSGKSFGEMANEVGTWKNEFGIAVGSSLNLFARLRKDAQKTGLVTGKYFEKVMNAASSLVVYGNRLKDVSTLYSDLAKSMNLPAEAAAELAKTLLKGPQEFSVEQRVLNSMLGDSHRLLKEQLVKYQKELKGKTGDEKKEIEERISKIKFALDTKNFPNQMEQLRAEFETLDPKERLMARVNALKKAMGSVGKQFNLLDPKKAGEFITSFKATMMKVGEPLGVDEAFLNGLQKTFEGLTSNSDNLKKLSKTFGVNSQDLMEAMTSQDAGEVGKVLKPAFAKLGWDPVKIKKAFEDAGLGQLVKNIDVKNKNQEQILHNFSTGLAAIKSSFDKLGLDKGGGDAEKLKKSALDMASDTTAIKDVLENTMTEIQFGMLDGITGILHYSKGIFKTVRTTLEGWKKSKLWNWLKGDEEKAKTTVDIEDKIAELSGNKENYENIRKMILEEKAKGDKADWEKIDRLTKAMNKAGKPQDQANLDTLRYVQNQLEKNTMSRDMAQAYLNKVNTPTLDVENETARLSSQGEVLNNKKPQAVFGDGGHSGETENATLFGKITYFFKNLGKTFKDSVEQDKAVENAWINTNKYLKENTPEKKQIEFDDFKKVLAGEQVDPNKVSYDLYAKVLDKTRALQNENPNSKPLAVPKETGVPQSIKSPTPYIPIVSAPLTKTQPYTPEPHPEMKINNTSPTPTPTSTTNNDNNMTFTTHIYVKTGANEKDIADKFVQVVRNELYNKQAVGNNRK